MKLKYTKKAYEAHANRLLDCVADMGEDKDLPDELGATLLLEQAVDLCWHIFGPKVAMEAVDSMVRERIKQDAKEAKRN